MAKFEDAATGWDIFRTRRGAVSRAQLNQALRARGRMAISERTYNHYRKLERLGYSEYVSINRLDVRHANDSIFDISDRSRYLEQAYSNPGTLVVPRGTSLIELSGTIDRVSEGFVVLRVPRSKQATEAARATKYNKGILRFDQVDVERAVGIVEGVEQDGEISLLLEFRSLLETDLLGGESPFPQVASRFAVDLGAEASLYRILSAVHTSFDLFESARGFIQVASSADGDDAVLTPTLRVRRMEFSNPLELILIGAVVVVGTVAYIVDKVSTSIGGGADAVGKVQGIKHETTAERRREELHQAQLKALQLDNVKKAIEVSELLENARPGLVEAMGVDLPELEGPAVPRLEALKDQAVEAAAELSVTTDEEIVIELADDQDES